MVAFGTHVLIAFDVGAVEDGVAFDALLPQALWHGAGAFTPGVAAHTGRQNFVYPAHGCPRHPVEDGIINVV
jgi:hypothetical protein